MPLPPIVDEDIIFILFFLIFSIAIGIVVYRFSLGLGWIDSFYNATMMLSGTGLVASPTSTLAKIVISLYALYSGLVFLVIIGIIVGRVVAVVA